MNKLKEMWKIELPLTDEEKLEIGKFENLLAENIKNYDFYFILIRHIIKSLKRNIRIKINIIPTSTI